MNEVLFNTVMIACLVTLTSVGVLGTIAIIIKLYKIFVNKLEMKFMRRDSEDHYKMETERQLMNLQSSINDLTFKLNNLEDKKNVSQKKNSRR